MALFYGGNTKTPLMDQAMSTAVRRRWAEAWGIGFAVVALALAAALWSFDIGDPSWHSSPGRPALNLLGEPGAWIADVLIRFAGVGAWALVVWLGVWAVRFILHLGEERIWARLIPAVCAIAIAPLFASTHAVYDAWPLSQTGLGGKFGDLGARVLLDSIPLPDWQALKALGLGLGMIMLIVGGMALGFTTAEAGSIWNWLSRSMRDVLGMAAVRGAHASRAGLAASRNKIAEIRAKPRSETMKPAEPTGTWRARMPKMPEVSLPKMPLLNVGNKSRREPELDLGRITGTPSDSSMPDALLNTPEPIGQDRPALRTAFTKLSEEGFAAEPESAAASDIDAVTEQDIAINREISARADIGELDQTRAAVARDTRPQRMSRRAEAERQPCLALDQAPMETFEPPALALLQKPVSVVRSHTSDIALEENARMLETVLEDYGVRGEITAVRPGPVVTLYELEPAPGLKASRVIGLADDIARSMSALAARVSTVPGRSVIGIELPNTEREKVWLRDLFEARDYGDARFPLALALGKDISGAPVVSNLAKMPHLLIAGTTGSGKSVAINTMILSLLYRLSPQQCRLIMIDPKMLELSVYDNIPHLLAPVVTDPKKAIVALKWVVAEMEERYRKMSKMGVRNIDGYNARVRDAMEKGEEFSRTVQTGFDDDTGEPVYETETFEPQEMPFIVVIVDEMADLMMVAGKEIEACIQRLAQMARASGIHLIMATQRPSVDVITGTIKANFPTRISFQVTSKIDSRTILGEQGAEQLLGMGDMLFMEGGGRVRRVHGPFVSDEEVEEVVAHLKSLGVPDYVNAVTDGVDEEAQALVDQKLGLAAPGSSEDALYDHAVAIVARDRKCSTSYIQRKLAIGYNKAARLVEQMEDEGVVTPANAVGKREILVEER
ncbi:MAG: DNA translocase FtsK 4TM domain-containing protein [Paracoccaceae bacterium]